MILNTKFTEPTPETTLPTTTKPSPGYIITYTYILIKYE